MKNKINSSLLFIILMLASNWTVMANYQREKSLKGSWKFSIGDNKDWALPNYDDKDWDQIFVPARWEEQGYRGYDGFAWYRIQEVVPSDFENREVFLEIGYIDDVDEVYFNGEKIGKTGSFPPDFSTAYNAFRRYRVPSGLIKFGGVNTIAVRVYDAQLEGGIVRGEVKLAAGDIAVIPDIDMNGYWNFNTGKEPVASGKTIMVPGMWENQGFNNYDGYAVYSRLVEVPEKMARQKLVFLAGRIDDDDRVYINGELVGYTGDFNNRGNTDMHREFRNYFIPDGLIKPGKNLVVIKVLDRGGEGGILEGNVGLITQDNFIRYWRMKRR